MYKPFLRSNLQYQSLIYRNTKENTKHNFLKLVALMLPLLKKHTRLENAGNVNHSIGFINNKKGKFVVFKERKKEKKKKKEWTQ